MTPSYDAAGLRLYQGSVFDVLPLIELADVCVVVSDPPYADHWYLRNLRERQELHLEDDAEWATKTFTWVGGWFYLMRALLKDQAVAGWFFVNAHYLGHYVRWAAMLKWPVRHVWTLADGEFLVAVGVELSAAKVAQVAWRVRRNVYGSGKDVKMLRGLLELSPSGQVLDPFAGRGSTLIAARQEGRPALGIELDPATLAIACAALAQETVASG
jgi:hypothetical protein